MDLKATLSEYTVAEFQQLVNTIWAVDVPKHEHDALINHFDRIAGHPAGADLLFYQQDEIGINSAEWVVSIVRTWHRNQGISVFRGDTPPVLPVNLRMSALERSSAQVQKVIAELAVADQNAEQACSTLEQVVRSMEGLSGTLLDILVQESNIRALEEARRTSRQVSKAFESWKIRVESVRNATEGSLKYASTEQAQWQNLVQQLTATSNQYLTRLAVITQRHGIADAAAQAWLNLAQPHLQRSRISAKLGPIDAEHVIYGQLNLADQRPALLLQTQSAVLELEQQMDLLKSIRSVVGELTWRNTTGASSDLSVGATVLNFGFLSRADMQIYGLGVPLIELAPIEGEDWLTLAERGAELEIPFRMSSGVLNAAPGAWLLGMKDVQSALQVRVTASKVMSGASRVRVRPARAQGENLYSFTADGDTPITVSWSNSPAFINGSAPEQSQSRRLSFVYSHSVPPIEPLPQGDDVYFDDYIVVFPQEAKVDPVYVMLRNRQEYPV